MRRDRWQNLNGLWRFAMVDTVADDADLPGQILVPFPIESALSGVAERLLDRTAIYRRTFEVPDDFRGGDSRVLMHFGAVDFDSTVLVNGRQVGRHKGGYDPFSHDVTDALKEGQNTVEVRVVDPTTNGTQPRGKQSLNPEGIWYEPVSGIWQTVWLEPVPATHVQDLKIVPDLEAGAVRVTVEASRNAAVRLGVPGGASVTGRGGEEIELPVADPRPWSPGDPHLYDLRVELVGEDAEVLDAVDSYFALRSVGLHKGEGGRVDAIALNGRPLFQVGPLDQGWWPDGLYTAPTDEALRYDVEVTKDLGFNMIRKHIKVEPARWYYHCDRLGVLVWQDMPNIGFGPNGPSAEAKGQFQAELTRMVDALENHPSIAMWVVFNEG